MITHVIFDLDGTLIDSAPTILATMARILERRGIEPVVRLDKHLIGPPLPSTLRTITGSADEALIDALVSEFRESYDTQGIYATPLYPGVEEMLRTLHEAGKRLFVATNKRERPTRLLLEHFAWTPLFQGVYCSDSRSPAFASKDEMLRTLVEVESLASDSAVFVGDTPADGRAASSNAMPFLAATWGYGNWEGADKVACHPAWQAMATSRSVTEFALQTPL